MSNLKKRHEKNSIFLFAKEMAMVGCEWQVTPVTGAPDERTQDS